MTAIYYNTAIIPTVSYEIFLSLNNERFPNVLFCSFNLIVCAIQLNNSL